MKNIKQWQRSFDREQIAIALVGGLYTAVMVAALLSDLLGF